MNRVTTFTLSTVFLLGLAVPSGEAAAQQTGPTFIDTWFERP